MATHHAFFMHLCSDIPVILYILVTSDDLRNDLVSLDSVPLAVFQRLIAEGEVFDSFLTDRCATLIRIQLSSTIAYRTRSRYYVLIRPTDAERSTADLIDLCAQIFLRSNIGETSTAVRTRPPAGFACQFNSTRVSNLHSEGPCRSLPGYRS
jgi:hypothetical protein